MKGDTSASGGGTPAEGSDTGLAPESLHQEILVSHSRRPRNYQELADPDVRVRMDNPSCGDEIVLTLRMEGERIAGIGFVGQGCSISRASASMMTVLLQERTLGEAVELTADFRDLVQGRATADRSRPLGELGALAGVARFPVRVRCALLAWNALVEAARQLRDGTVSPSGPTPPA